MTAEPYEVRIRLRTVYEVVRCDVHPPRVVESLNDPRQAVERRDALNTKHNRKEK